MAKLITLHRAVKERSGEPVVINTAYFAGWLSFVHLITKGRIMENFEHELAQLINKYSEENQSHTPDFILAHYLASCLDIFNFALIQRTQWYHLEPKQYSFFKSYNNF